ncbi:MAG: FIST C-terminal domain-containing protein [Planctomycetes bacterium]|nr:FIST C-terminal domain-containing protein [Planctomycetota bacterium]
MQISRLTYCRATGWSAQMPELDSEHTLVLTFGGSDFAGDPKPFADLARAFPKAVHLGCSTSGEIQGANVLDDSMVVAVVRFDRTRLDVAFAQVANPDESYAAGLQIAEQLAQHDDLRAVFVLSDGLQVNGSSLVRGLNHILPTSTVVTGGLAGDGVRFRSTWNLLDGRPVPGLVGAVGLYGDAIRVGHGSKGGWDIFGPERRVTRSVGNVLYELDGRPALQLYKEYLGDRAAGLPATGLLFPLALRAKAADEKRLVRTILAVDEDAQSMTFAGDVPEGSLAQLMRANFDRLIEGAANAGSISCLPTSGPTLAIAISCVGRRLVLGERTEEEVEAVLRALPAGTEQIGFYSYGELSPYATGGCDLHNQTMTITTFSEV